MSSSKYQTQIYQKYELLNKKELRARIKKVQADQKNYPGYHLAPTVGLLNDPNGLAYFNNEYHLFYQYCPNGITHGMKSWNHVTTTDFINFKDHGVILSSQEEYENYGIFSGGAKVINDKLYLFYTGNHRDENNNFKRSPYQCVAIMNKNYQIESRRVFIEPNSKFTEHFRDPVMVKNEYLLIGAQSLNLQGEIAIVKLANLDFKCEEYQEIQVLKNNWQLDAYMFECPNYFEQEHQAAMIFSPQGIKPSNKYQYQNIYDVVYSVGLASDLEQGKWSNPEVKQLDYGFDFYAPQTFNDNQGRTIMIAWLGQAETKYPGDEENEWSQLLSLPRTLKIKSNHLYQIPLEELKQLRGEQLIEKNNQIKLPKSSQFEAIIFTETNFKLTIGNEKEFIDLVSDGEDIIFDRSKMSQQVNQQYGTKRIIPKVNVDKIQLFLDKSVLEIFINDGEYTLSSRIFIDDCSLLTMKNCQLVEGYELNKINYIKGREL